jgi:hypothetical protein
VCLPAGVDGSHTVEVEEDVGAEVGVGVEKEEEGEPRSSPRQICPSAGFAATTAYAGAHSVERDLRRVVSAGAAASVESAGLPERGNVSVIVFYAPSWSASWCAAGTVSLIIIRREGGDARAQDTSSPHPPAHRATRAGRAG